MDSPHSFPIRPISERDSALDIFRGLAVAGMAIVNLQDPFRPSAPAFLHAEWDGLNFADLVFPMFIVAVGMSVSLAAQQLNHRAITRIFRRTAVLMAWGLILNWMLHPNLRFWDVRALGVLQRIAVVYAVCALVTRKSTAWTVSGAFALCLFLLHTYLLLCVRAPGETSVSFHPGAGISGWLDRQFIPGRMPRRGYDPEGILSTLSAVAEGLIGSAVMLWLRGRSEQSIRLVILGGALMLIGALTSKIMPINKQLWTPAFALLSAGLGLLVFAMLRLSVKGRLDAPLKLLARLGRIAMTFYVIHTVLIAALLLKSNHVRWWDRLVDSVATLGPSPQLANTIAAVSMAILCLVASNIVQRRGSFLTA